MGLYTTLRSGTDATEASDSKTFMLPEGAGKEWGDFR